MTELELHEAALAYLARQAASAAQLRRVLERRVRRKKADLDDALPTIERLVERFRQNGLLDDARFAAARADRLSRAGRSRRAIAAHLAQKGVDAETARAALPDDDLASAITFAKKRRIGPFAPAAPDDDALSRDERRARQQKALGAMGRAGFSFEVCDRVLRMDLEEALERLDGA